MRNCPACGSAVTSSDEDVDFQYGEGADAVTLTAHHQVFTCHQCEMTYTDEGAELARKWAIDRHVADTNMLAFLKQLKPCPFCGYKLENNVDDSFYPVGNAWWRDSEEVGCRIYVGAREREEGDQPVYGLHCPPCSGGCGAEMSADTPEDAVAKWNRRA